MKWAELFASLTIILVLAAAAGLLLVGLGAVVIVAALLVDFIGYLVSYVP